MSRFCVIAGTKISLTNGNSLPIEQIKAGEEVLSFDLNTLQRSQKYDVLVKLKTNDFSGIIKKDYVKNIWKNTADEYFAINDRLKITGDHIVLAKRDNTYYWTKVFNLKIGDYLFTEFNIFEKIETMILIKEKVKVFNLEVNSIYNYFANSYLIHNGAPCSACDACGLQGTARNVWVHILTRLVIDSSTADYTGNWDVSEDQFGYTGTGRIYIVTKVSASPTFRQDQCIAAVQHVNSAGTVIKNGWNFDNSDDYEDWDTTSSEISGTSTAGLEGGDDISTPFLASGKTFSTVANYVSKANDNYRWSRLSGTGSPNTGMADGIDINVSTTHLSVGNDQISQASSTFYLHREGSEPNPATGHPTRYSKVILRSPEISFSSGDKIRVCQHLTTNEADGGVTINANDALFMGIY